MISIGEFIFLLGCLFLLISSVGLLRLRDALTRQHAATKAGTFSLGLMIIGVMIEGHGLSWLIKGTLILLGLICTLPISSHMLARASLKEQTETPAQSENYSPGS